LGSCNGSTYTIQNCFDSSCLNCFSSYTNSTACAAYPNFPGLYSDIICGVSTSPVINYPVVTEYVYGFSNCAGNFYDEGRIITDYCVNSITSSYKYSCSSGNSIFTTCTGTNCTVNCVNTTYTSGICGNGQTYYCQTSIASSHHSTTSSHHSTTSSHHSPTSSTSHQPYLILNIYSSSTCSANEIGIYAVSTSCLPASNGFYEIASCSNGKYSVSSCADSSCSNCAVTLTNSTSCSTFVGGLYATATCATLPNKNLVYNNTYPNNNCMGTAYSSIGYIPDVCFNNPFSTTTNFVMYSCNSTYVTTTTCSNSACSQNCTSTYTPVGCANSAKNSVSCQLANFF